MTRLLALFTLLLVAACSEAPDDTLYGYAEGDYRLLAPETAGTLSTIAVAEGEHVTVGTVLFGLDTRIEQAGVESAQARIEAAEARFDDAAAGSREPEIAAARDQLSQARATQVQTGNDLERARELFERGILPRARLDTAEAAANTANARVAELRERLALVQLPARENQLRALAAEVSAAQIELTRAQEALRRRTVSAPADGWVERQLRYEGEVAGPGAPVLRFLADGSVHGLVFVPQTRLGQIQVGTRLTLACDGCAGTTGGEIVFIANAPEFTAPIIYSDNERDRLVFRAEVRIDSAPPPPGTPLQARLTP